MAMLDNVKIDESIPKKEKTIPRKENNSSVVGLGLGKINIDIIEEVKTKQLTLYVKEDLESKLKTIAHTKKISLTKLVEMVLEETFTDIEIDANAVTQYNKKHRGKGRIKK